MTKRRTPEDSILKREIKKGLNGASIGKKYNVSRACICRHLKRLGLNQESPIGKKGNQHSQWKGGRGLKSGYWTVYNPKHHRAMNNGRVWEHIIILEKHLRKKITKDTPIHHIDMDRTNNSINNLIVCSKKEHANIHGSLEKVVQKLFKKGVIKFINNQYV